MSYVHEDVRLIFENESNNGEKGLGLIVPCARDLGAAFHLRLRATRFSHLG